MLAARRNALERQSQGDDYDQPVETMTYLLRDGLISKAERGYRRSVVGIHNVATVGLSILA